jgi:hypothetical protein
MFFFKADLLTLVLIRSIRSSFGEQRIHPRFVGCMQMYIVAVLVGCRLQRARLGTFSAVFDSILLSQHTFYYYL